MLKKILCGILSVVLAMSLLVGCGSTSDDTSDADSSADDSAVVENTGETYELTMAVATQDQALVETFADKVSEKTDGQVTITFVDLSSLGTADDAVSMVKNGTIDIYFNSPPQTASYFPVSDVFQLPFYFNSYEKTYEAAWALYEAGYLDEYDDGTKLLILSVTDSQMFAFKDTKVETIDQFSGMNVRIASGLTATLAENIGAAVVSMTFSDVYLSLDKGVIDGYMSSPVMMAPNALYDVTGYIMDLQVFNGGLIGIINEDTYNSLPTDIQEALVEAGKEQSEEILASNQENEAENLQTMIDNGTELYTPSDELVADLQAAAADIVDVYLADMEELGVDGEAIIAICEEIINE